jgi:hypothetical protein
MRKIGLTTVVLLVAFGFMLHIDVAFASESDEQSASELTAQWWQWVSSIPRTVNPVLDEDGKNCVVGQRGDVWFLAGTFGGAATRNCMVPEGKVLFFPVFNQAFFDSPNACGQDAQSFSVKDMRAFDAASIDAATTLSATLDGQPVKNINRVRSQVFEITLPEDNWVNAFVPCAAGVYSPSVDDGYYARVERLNPGSHTVHIQAASSLGASVDVTYHLTVVPVKLK